MSKFADNLKQGLSEAIKHAEENRLRKVHKTSGGDFLLCQPEKDISWLFMSDRWKYVTCKRCLAKRGKK